MEDNELNIIYKGVYIATIAVITKNIIDTIYVIDNNK
jgi:hypothetical protein